MSNTVEQPEPEMTELSLDKAIQEVYQHCWCADGIALLIRETAHTFEDDPNLEQRISDGINAIYNASQAIREQIKAAIDVLDEYDTKYSVGYRALLERQALERKKMETAEEEETA